MSSNLHSRQSKECLTRPKADIFAASCTLSQKNTCIDNLQRKSIAAQALTGMGWTCGSLKPSEQHFAA